MNHGPSGVNHGPSGVNHGPSGVNHGPSGMNHGPSGVNHGPSGMNHGPSGVNHGPSGVNHGPSGGNHGPSGVNHDISFQTARIITEMAVRASTYPGPVITDHEDWKNCVPVLFSSEGQYPALEAAKLMMTLLCKASWFRCMCRCRHYGKRVQKYRLIITVWNLKFSKKENCWYEGHSEITDTSLAFWRLGAIENSAHSKVKREDWTDREREKVGQLCPSTETGTVQGWAMVDSRCHLQSFNQPINDCNIT